jgi:hypothetical protein
MIAPRLSLCEEVNGLTPQVHRPQDLRAVTSAFYFIYASFSRPSTLINSKTYSFSDSGEACCRLASIELHRYAIHHAHGPSLTSRDGARATRYFAAPFTAHVLRVVEG